MIANCAYIDVSDFEHSGEKMFLLNISSEYQNLVKTFQAFLKISTVSKLNFHPVDTGRKLNVHKMFRRGPGRLLNVLCTFNLRPVYWAQSGMQRGLDFRLFLRKS